MSWNDQGEIGIGIGAALAAEALDVAAEGKEEDDGSVALLLLLVVLLLVLTCRSRTAAKQGRSDDLRNEAATSSRDTLVGSGSVSVESFFFFFFATPCLVRACAQVSKGSNVKQREAKKHKKMNGKITRVEANIIPRHRKERRRLVKRRRKV